MRNGRAGNVFRRSIRRRRPINRRRVKSRRFVRRTGRRSRFVLRNRPRKAVTSRIGSRVTPKVLFTVRATTSGLTQAVRGAGSDSINLAVVGFNTNLTTFDKCEQAAPVPSGLRMLRNQYAKCRVKKVTVVLSQFDGFRERVNFTTHSSAAAVAEWWKDFFSNKEPNAAIPSGTGLADDSMYRLEYPRNQRLVCMHDRTNADRTNLDSWQPNTTGFVSDNNLVKVIPLKRNTRLVYSFSPNGLAVKTDDWLVKTATVGSYLKHKDALTRRAPSCIKIGLEAPTDMVHKDSNFRIDRTTLRFRIDKYVQLEFSGRYHENQMAFEG